MYYKGKWCTAGGKDPLFGHVDGFQIDPISWAAPHNSARSLRQDFCSNSKFRKWRNTVCISHFRNCGSGTKRRLRLADAIVRCCPITGGGLTAPWLLFSGQDAKGQGRRYAARLALDSLRPDAAITRPEARPPRHPGASCSCISCCPHWVPAT